MEWYDEMNSEAGSTKGLQRAKLTYEFEVKSKLASCRPSILTFQLTFDTDHSSTSCEVTFFKEAWDLNSLDHTDVIILHEKEFQMPLLLGKFRQ